MSDDADAAAGSTRVALQQHYCSRSASITITTTIYTRIAAEQPQYHPSPRSDRTTTADTTRQHIADPNSRIAHCITPPTLPPFCCCAAGHRQLTFNCCRDTVAPFSRRYANTAYDHTAPSITAHRHHRSAPSRAPPPIPHQYTAQRAAGLGCWRCCAAQHRHRASDIATYIRARRRRRRQPVDTITAAPPTFTFTPINHHHHHHIPYRSSHHHRIRHHYAGSIADIRQLAMLLPLFAAVGHRLIYTFGGGYLHLLHYLPLRRIIYLFTQHNRFIYYATQFSRQRQPYTIHRYHHRHINTTTDTVPPPPPLRHHRRTARHHPDRTSPPSSRHPSITHYPPLHIHYHHPSLPSTTTIHHQLSSSTPPSSHRHHPLASSLVITVIVIVPPPSSPSSQSSSPSSPVATSLSSSHHHCSLTQAAPGQPVKQAANNPAARARALLTAPTVRRPDQVCGSGSKQQPARQQHSGSR